METPDLTDYYLREDLHLKEGEGRDEVLPINVDITYKTSKRESRRLSLPVIDNVNGGSKLTATNRKSTRAGQSISYSDPFAGSGRTVHPERRSTSMPEFYGLSELRAKHEKLSRQRSTRKVGEERTLKLPSLSAHKGNFNEDLLTAMDNPLQRKLYLPRINPNQRTTCLTKSRKTDVQNSPSLRSDQFHFYIKPVYVHFPFFQFRAIYIYRKFPGLEGSNFVDCKNHELTTIKAKVDLCIGSPI